MFIGPAALLFAAFSLIPIIIAVTLSFQDTQTLGDGQWVGLDNYAQIGSDRLRRTALLITRVCTIGTVPTPVLAGLALAVARNRPLAGRGVLGAMFFVPMGAAGVLVGVVMSWIYNVDYGIANNALGLFGI